ncbi:unnamed protein product [Kuraishia capsulata CBS 1993]|uniref:Ribonuclease T2-like n=1 Tax=Kuraishia capsulata CBS 1993 TaxID=1382522 RepID=W6MVQ4_9ASCO|nr:uncharacterized protein KUCA_T00006062001 [Kuraishia capsulata CBS 1993]CDK30067.1 unnamed protein product [Kuraishia capsulata CBS 1993]
MKLCFISLFLVISSLRPCLGFEFPFWRTPTVGEGLMLPLSAPEQCPLNPPLSCFNKTEVSNLCCFEYPGGILLQTQFWDYLPPVGPDDMFTLHGLWPDNCDGSYEQFCHNSETIQSGKKILEAFGEYDLLEKMNRIWKNFNGDDDSLWVHEFNKHGTCMTTLSPSCYDQSNYSVNQNVVDFYRASVDLYEQLPTFKWLSDNGIVPSEEQTYSKQQIEDTLSARFGQPVFVSCNRYHALQEVWYFHHLKGSITNGEYVPIPALANSKCPPEGIRFLPKSFKPSPTGGPPSQPKPTGGSGIDGYIKLTELPGCLIGNGRWYTSGTCARYKLIKAPFGGYNLKTSKGWCGIGATGDLECNPRIGPMQFGYDKERSLITYGGKLIWSADQTAGRFTQVPIYPGNTGDVTFKLKFESS